MRSCQNGLIFQNGDFTLLEQGAHAAAHALNDRIFARCDLRIIVADIACENACFFGFIHKGIIDLCRVKQCFGRDTAAIQAGAAHLTVLDDRGLKSKLRTADRCYIAAGACPDDNGFKIISARCRCRSCRCGSCRWCRRCCCRCGLFCRSLFSCRLSENSGDILSGLSDDCDDVGDRYFVALAVDDFEERTGRRSIHRDRQFVCFHFK